jgi:serine protease inhibitor
MRKYLAAFIVVVSCTSHNAILPDNPPNLRTLSVAEKNVSAASNDFAFDFFRQVQSDLPNENIFISPLSLTTVLAMTMNGAGDSTRKSIVRLLKLGNTPAEVDQACKDLTTLLMSMDRTVNLSIANSIWSNQQFAVRDSFATVIRNYFDGKVQSLNFSDPDSKSTINSWVASKTNNLIQNLVKELTPQDVMLLVNAIYFKGNWTFQFDPSKTYDAPFYHEDGTSQNVKTMFSKGATISYYANSNLTLIDIPYGNQQFMMTVLMPTANYSVDQLARNLNADSLSSWLNYARSITSQLELPKFTMRWGKDFLDDLKAMGMRTSGFLYLFKDDLPMLEISRVIQQSYISVDEVGTEAAAATYVAITMTTSGVPQPETIKINRPFVYLIREKHTDAILFMGKMLLPPQTQ